MAISAQEAQSIGFGEGRRGYDEREVDQFRERVVTTLRAYEAELAKSTAGLQAAQQRISELEDAEEAVKRTFLAASRTKREMEEEAQAQAARLVADATADADQVGAAAKAEAEELRSAARADADAMRNEAREDAATTRSNAENEATRLLTEARQHAAAAKEQTENEVKRLERRLAQLRTSVTDLEQRLKAFAAGALDEVAVVSGLIDLEVKGFEEIEAFQAPDLPETPAPAPAISEGEAG